MSKVFFAAHEILILLLGLIRYVDEDGGQVVPETSVEYMRMLDWLRRSPYFVADPQMACLFVPSVDTLGVQHALAPEVLANLALYVRIVFCRIEFLYTVYIYYIGLQKTTT